MADGQLVTGEVVATGLLLADSRTSVAGTIVWAFRDLADLPRNGADGPRFFGGISNNQSAENCSIINE